MQKKLTDHSKLEFLRKVPEKGIGSDELYDLTSSWFKGTTAFHDLLIHYHHNQILQFERPHFISGHRVYRAKFYTVERARLEEVIKKATGGLNVKNNIISSDQNLKPMTIKEKYQKVLDLGLKFGVRDGYVEEGPGLLKIGGLAKTQYEKNRMWDLIKEAGGENPTDIEADIKVEDTSVYHRHTVKSGESLSLIAKHYYRDPMKYKQIFAANTNILKNPDIIHPGQELVIPNI